MSGFIITTKRKIVAECETQRQRFAPLPLELWREIYALKRAFERAEQAPWRRRYNAVMAQLFWLTIACWRTSMPAILRNVPEADKAFKRTNDGRRYCVEDEAWRRGEYMLEQLEDCYVVLLLERAGLPLRRAGFFQ
jgi:hypothetical protein